MNIRTSAIFYALITSIISASAYALEPSQTTGPIKYLRVVNPGNGLPGRVAVSVLGAINPPCTANVYVFENGDTGIGKVMTSFLMTAYSLGKNVTIIGDGVCHTYSDVGSTPLEGVSKIELGQ